MGPHYKPVPCPAQLQPDEFHVTCIHLWTPMAQLLSSLSSPRPAPPPPSTVLSLAQPLPLSTKLTQNEGRTMHIVRHHPCDCQREFPTSNLGVPGLTVMYTKMEVHQNNSLHLISSYFSLTSVTPDPSNTSGSLQRMSYYSRNFYLPLTLQVYVARVGTSSISPEDNFSPGRLLHLCSVNFYQVSLAKCPDAGLQSRDGHCRK